jgi:hypothetical protein
MKNCLVVAVALASFLICGCEQQPTAPPAQASPTPEATPTATPQATPTATPEATPTATPEATPTATPEASPTATPEATPTATPETTPGTTAPSPTTSPSAADFNTRPTLSSRSANEYMQSYELYISDFETAYRAMKNGDMTKYQTVIQRAQELKTKSDKLAGELNPEEEQRFANFLNKKANELAQFASQNH